MADGRISTVTAPGNRFWNYSYDAYKKLTKVDVPNGMTTEYVYDALGRQTAIQHKDGNTVVQGFTYAFTNDNNITRLIQQDGTKWAYQYDNRLRLTQAERYSTDGTTLLHRYNYTYDNGDNMLSKAIYDATAQTTATTTMAYDNANELTSTTSGGVTTTYTYDAWGNTTSKTDGTYTATYAYKYGSKLASMTSTFPGEADVTYEYNGSGKRIARTTGGITKRYRRGAGWNVVNEENGSGVLVRTYFGKNMAHADGTNPTTGTWEYYTQDNLGSSRGIWNDDRSNYADLEYTPYGESYISTGTPTSITQRFTGHDWDDASDLYYTPYRYYTPANSRWLNRDPIGEQGGINLYGYVHDDPINRIDSLGLASETKSIWVCQRSFGAPAGPKSKPWIGPFHHDFITCQDPLYNIDPEDPRADNIIEYRKKNVVAWGKQPRPFNEKGPDITGKILGHGVIEREPLENYDWDEEFAHCRERKLCPGDYTRMCPNTTADWYKSDTPYFMGLTNCQLFAFFRIS